MFLFSTLRWCLGTTGVIREYSSSVHSTGVSVELSPVYHRECLLLVALDGRNLNRLVSWKVRSRVTQRCPRRDCIGTTGQADTTVGLLLACGHEMLCSTKVELFRANGRQGKDTVHLVGNRTSWWDDRVGTTVTSGPGCCRCPRLIKKGATIALILIEN